MAAPPTRKSLTRRVNTLRVMSFIQLALGLILFGIGVALTGADMEQFADRNEHPRNRVNNRFRILVPQPLTSINTMSLAIPLIVLAVGVGVSGSVLSRNLHIARYLLIVLPAMSFMASLSFMTFQSMLTFEFVDAELLEFGAQWEKSMLALQLVMLILAFLNALFAVITTALATFWTPPVETDPPLPNYQGLEQERQPKVPSYEPMRPRGTAESSFSPNSGYLSIYDGSSGTKVGSRGGAPRPALNRY